MPDRVSADSEDAEEQRATAAARLGDCSRGYPLHLQGCPAGSMARPRIGPYRRRRRRQYVPIMSHDVSTAGRNGPRLLSGECPARANSLTSIHRLDAHRPSRRTSDARADAKENDMDQHDPFGFIGLTYDDVLLLPGHTDVIPSEADTVVAR